MKIKMITLFFLLLSFHCYAEKEYPGSGSHGVSYQQDERPEAGSGSHGIDGNREMKISSFNSYVRLYLKQDVKEYLNTLDFATVMSIKDASLRLAILQMLSNGQGEEDIDGTPYVVKETCWDADKKSRIVSTRLEHGSAICFSTSQLIANWSQIYPNYIILQTLLQHAVHFQASSTYDAASVGHLSWGTVWPLEAGRAGFEFSRSSY